MIVTPTYTYPTLPLSSTVPHTTAAASAAIIIVLINRLASVGCVVRRLKLLYATSIPDRLRKTKSHATFHGGDTKAARVAGFIIQRSNVDQVAECTDADHAAMAVAVMPSSLAHRALIIGLMERVAAACAKCVLQTVASVCGADCVKERLHIATDFEVEPLPCLPELAARLARGEAEGLARAVAAGEPIGLVLPASSSPFTDLYVPAGGAGRYRGTDGGAFAYACDEAVHGPLLAISPSSPTDGAACDGDLWIDMRTGLVRSELVADGSEGTPAVPVDFELGWTGCSEYLPIDAPPAEVRTKVFLGADSSSYIACWLRRFFGRQAPLPGPNGQQSFVVELPDGVSAKSVSSIRHCHACRVSGAV